jgi:hypothetical protein
VLLINLVQERHRSAGDADLASRLQERAAVGRISRPRPKAKPKFLHEVRVGCWETDQPWLAELLADIGGDNGFKKRTPFWAYTIFSFDQKEQADELERHLRDRRELQARIEARARPCPMRTQYEEAARAQHAVIWGLSTGIIRDVVRTYRRERGDCSTHGMPNWIASNVVLAAAPSIDRDRAREMVDQMLAWVIERHGSWFWTGLQGDHDLKLYA